MYVLVNKIVAGKIFLRIPLPASTQVFHLKFKTSTIPILYNDIK